ncbi:hypothetical protein HPHPP23_1086 [Helicobacter pylori Hp P-23]|uniref:Uncharacterized protein n=1 Tax=Helicobacter pylori Hp H-6 TaxID=992061 RepID=J0DCN6_HELPX|nr:hypothetical protein HPHPH27_1348 [Helicobacter pylori Hp H-27]EJB83608.1 hypothetical protein HPHPH6_0818 [Helicobacter pylori Hp H-6]EJC12828.1 hypothetical protein HPHPP23_1086 [Helicobacter pylori Hp P-23]EJC16549.1 hypothetical protein HPHPP74_1360 [Helicobacter pylori Hp P-74]
MKISRLSAIKNRESGRYYFRHVAQITRGRVKNPLNPLFLVLHKNY